MARATGRLQKTVTGGTGHNGPTGSILGLLSAKQGEYLPKGVESPNRLAANMAAEKSRFRPPGPGRGKSPGDWAGPRPVNLY